MDFLLHVHEGTMQLYVFASLLLLVGVAETFFPALELRQSTGARWLQNLVLMLLGNLVARAVFPLMAVGWAVWVREQGWGLEGDGPMVAAGIFLFAILAMDFTTYAQHVLLHRVPALWRLHRVHHSDGDYDCTTGLRFHPVESVFSMGVRLAVIGLLGLDPAGVGFFELWMMGATLFTHANFHVPPWLERWLRLVMVTPDLHRVHHSADPREFARNYGNIFPWWDRLLGTYRFRPAATQRDMRIGLPDLPGDKPFSLWALLAMPLSRPGK